MFVAQQNVVQPALKDFETKVTGVLHDAWSDWMGIPADIRSKFDKTTRANCVFNFIMKRADSAFADDREIKILPKGRTAQYLFKGTVLARFKKANPKGIGSNITTNAVLNFVHPQYNLIDLPVHHVEFCYEEDPYATRIASITVNARLLKHRVWSYTMERPESATIVPIITSPQNDPPGMDTIVRARDTDDNKKNTDENGSSE